MKNILCILGLHNYTEITPYHGALIFDNVENFQGIRDYLYAHKCKRCGKMYGIVKTFHSEGIHCGWSSDLPATPNDLFDYINQGCD